MDTLAMTWPINDRINMVFLSDGYQKSELDKFIDDAHWMMDALLGKEPYPAYRGYFNCFAIKIPSAVSGAANDPGICFGYDTSYPGIVAQSSSPAQSDLGFC